MKGYKHLTTEQKQAILACYQRTLSTGTVLQEVEGVSIDQVRHLLKKHGIQLSGAVNGACYRHIDEVRQWAKEGVSLSEIARRIGTNHHRVADFLEKHGFEHKEFVQSGENNPAWKGGRMIEKPEGYVLVHKPDHPSANRHGYVREHRLVIEQKLGRFLLPTEVVHHIDGNPANNHPDNLRLYSSNGEHLSETLAGQAPNISPEGWARISESTRQMNMRRRKTNHAESIRDDCQ